MANPSIVVLVTGVSGTGKTTVGRALATALGWEFIEGDAFHPAANIAKMSRGEPLDDDDRRPWLEALRRAIDQRLGSGCSAVLACSALKRSYRRVLRHPLEDRIPLVFLDVPASILRARLNARRGHYFPASLIQSQLDALECPTGEPWVVAVDGTESVDRITATIRRSLAI